MRAKIITRNLANRRHYLVPRYVATHFGHPSQRVATFRFRMHYTAVQAQPEPQP